MDAHHGNDLALLIRRDTAGYNGLATARQRDEVRHWRNTRQSAKGEGRGREGGGEEAGGGGGRRGGRGKG